MKRKTMLFFFCATIVWCTATTVAFGQNPAASQGQARLRAYTIVMSHGGTAAARQNSPSSPILPLWTFNVSSSLRPT
jgi:hypothetical protein